MSTDLLAQDYDSNLSLEDMISEVERSNELSTPKKTGRPAGLPKTGGKGKDFFTSNNWAKLSNSAYVSHRIREVLDQRDFSDLSTSELLKHLDRFNAFIEPKLAAVKQQLTQYQRVDISNMSQDQLDVLSSLQLTDSPDPLAIEDIPYTEPKLVDRMDYFKQNDQTDAESD